MSENPYALAAAYAENGSFDQAWKIVGALLNHNPNDVAALVCGGYIMIRTGCLPQAYHFSKAATRLAPNEDGAWQNLAEAAQKLCLLDEAESYLKRALKCVKSEANRQSITLNLSALYVDRGNFKAAEECARGLLKLDPTNRNALANLGFCQLANHEWAEGWKNYHNTVGSNWRKRVNYQGEPEWDGTPGKTVVVYADQGIGDEISFASMIPDAAKLCKKLILDCDGRLEHLFRRSFPGVKVYGTKIKSQQKWAKEDRAIDASLSIGQLGEFVRTKASDFTGKPYLVPCPNRTEAWRRTFGGSRTPTIGIAWTGGVPHTNARNRRISLEDLLPVLDLDANFVSLQYKDAEQEIQTFWEKYRGRGLVQYRWATLTDDYDDTAALVAACDYVLCIQTAVARTAGALGVPCSVLLPTQSNWFYSTQGEQVPWHESIRVIRQQRSGSWKREIELAAERITNLFGLRGAASAAPRVGSLRNGLDCLRANGRDADQPASSHAPT
jgi:tetratricopeptide (TPR) repeat protein